MISSKCPGRNRISPYVWPKIGHIHGKILRDHRVCLCMCLFWTPGAMNKNTRGWPLSTALALPLAVFPLCRSVGLSAALSAKSARPVARRPPRGNWRTLDLLTHSLARIATSGSGVSAGWVKRPVARLRGKIMEKEEC